MKSVRLYIQNFQGSLSQFYESAPIEIQIFWVWLFFNLSITCFHPIEIQHFGRSSSISSFHAIVSLSITCFHPIGIKSDLKVTLTSIILTCCHPIEIQHFGRSSSITSFHAIVSLSITCFHPMGIKSILKVTLTSIILT